MNSITQISSLQMPESDLDKWAEALREMAKRAEAEHQRRSLKTETLIEQIENLSETISNKLDNLKGFQDRLAELEAELVRRKGANAK
jgi:signal transduction histidine kinase